MLFMTQLKKNIIANFIGSSWTALMGIVFSPLYILFMGVEAFGLVGLYLTMVSMFYVLGIGISTALNREMTRYSANELKPSTTRDLLRTLEIIYWLGSLLAGGVIVLLSSSIAYQWLPESNLSKEVIERCLVLIGLITTSHLLVGFYSGGLQGLQKQVLLNGINIIMATLRFGGVIPILWLVSSSPVFFFFWQLIITVLHTLVVGYCLWIEFPKGFRRARIQIPLLKEVRKFALNTSGANIIGMFFFQIDKIILSKVISLQMFGYYSLASIIAMSLAPRIAGPFHVALFPRFTELVSANNISALRQLYHHSCQLLSALLLPVSIFIAFFSKEILYIWTQDISTANNTCEILSILSIAYVCTGLMYIPYALQLAHSWANLAFFCNLFAVITVIPLILIMNKFYGVIGVASSLLLVNFCCAVLSVQIMHRYILEGENWKWYISDVAKPALVSIFTAIIGKIIVNYSYSNMNTIVILIFTLFCIVLFAALSMPYSRQKIIKNIDFFRSLKKK